MKNKKNIIHRLSIIEGQIRGIKKMIEEEQQCKAIVTQVTAAKSAFENTLALILTENLETCLAERLKNNENVDSAIKEAIVMITKTI